MLIPNPTPEEKNSGDNAHLKFHLLDYGLEASSFPSYLQTVFLLIFWGYFSRFLLLKLMSGKQFLPRSSLCHSQDFGYTGNPSPFTSSSFWSVRLDICSFG